MSALEVAPATAGPVRKDLADIVCCPVDKAELTLKVDEEDEHGDVVRGSFTCTQCGFVYPIEEGIPNLLPPEYHVDEVQETA